MTDELVKCVWMTAGVLNFRLCDREFDCEHCLIDLAFRETGSVEPAGEATEIGARRHSAGRLSPSGFYHRRHVWARVGAGGMAWVGIDDLARRLLGRVDRILGPEVGEMVQADQEAWALTGEAGELALPSPVTGLVVARNDELLANPAVMRAGDRREPWLARVRPRSLRDDLGRLRFGRRAERWAASESDLVGRRLMESRAAAGALPDGGTLDESALETLEPGLRRALASELLAGPGEREKGR